jgi:phosphoribosylamine---glycine ligase
MKILLIGNGGRENALAWKIFNSETFKKTGSTLYCAKGNPGIDQFAVPIDLDPSDVNSLVSFSIEKHINFCVVGPEIPLSLGIVNEFERNGIKIFGPSQKAAELETSKIFSKKILKKNKIPTAGYKKFSKKNIPDAKKFIKNSNYPLVLKADGLAAGKGVIIVNNENEALNAISDFTEKNIFGKAGWDFIIEEFISGEEVSVFVITDGEDYIILPLSQDYKRIGEEETGKNTGGMGAVAPVKKFINPELLDKIENKIIRPLLSSMKEMNRTYKGCLYCGIMIKDNEPYVIEFNCRFGDPETQAVLPLIKSDFLELLMASSNNTISNYKLEIENKFSACVVLASEGYPGKYESGKKITGIDSIDNNCIVFHAGTKFEDNKSEILSNGGRVLNVVGISESSLEDAIKIAYENAEKINFENKYFRKDIGKKTLRS